MGLELVKKSFALKWERLGGRVCVHVCNAHACVHVYQCVFVYT